MARKFIIENNEFKLGNVGYHRELAEDPTKVYGGGYWVIQKGILYLYSTSQDFGSLTFEQIKKVKEDKKVEDEKLLNLTWIFSSKHEFADAKLSGIEV